MTKLLNKLANDRKGATAIEYGLIAAFIALAIVATLPGIGKALGTTFNGVNAALTNANN
ncbi:MAG: Flp family type IVb pilin [Phenylobacterium sp.]|nr:MAG: Flp family type IVb pilin [Phenylobacterium sp.]